LEIASGQVDVSRNSAQSTITVSIPAFREDKCCGWLPGILRILFIGKVRDEAINRQQCSGSKHMSNNRFMRVLLVIGLVAGITLAVSYRDQFDAAALEAWVRDTGPVAPLLFMLIYALATVLFLPGSVLTLAGGALFGPVLGTFCNLTGATLGATLAFLIARYLAADWVASKAGGRVKQLITGVEGEGWRFVAFVRLVPLFPFNLLNYALGLTQLRLLHYILATYVFMLPGALAYTYLGYAGREAVAGGEGMIQKGLLAVALLAMVAFLPRLISNLRRGPMIDIPEFRQRIDTEKNLLVLDVRTPEDFIGEQGHIEDAVNIPAEELQQRMNEIGNYLEHPVAIVCGSEKKSAKTARLLTEAGFTNVHIVSGGMAKWIEAGLPVIR
jgi:uncharacterized membrane protein YdjX (TVP38/TMEM64 family)/rhodanese-related sulfurtransferase